MFTPPGGSAATIALKAAVLDATAPPAYADSDSNAGNISNATVTFKEGSTTLCTTVILDSPADIKVGTASCNATLNNVDTHTLEIVVNGYYTGGQTGIEVEVAQPDGNFITGGGYLNCRSGGASRSAGSKMNSASTSSTPRAASRSRKAT